MSVHDGPSSFSPSSSCASVFLLCFGTYVLARVRSGFSICGATVVDGISGWGGGMTAAFGYASSWLDAEGPEVDAVVANGCGGDGFGAAR